MWTAKCQDRCAFFAWEDDGLIKLPLPSVVSGAFTLLHSPFLLLPFFSQPTLTTEIQPAKMADLDVSQNGPSLTLTHNQSALIFLGTGCSSAVPNAMCLIQPSDPPCRICSLALSLPPEKNPNYRWFHFPGFFSMFKSASACLLTIGIVPCLDRALCLFV